MRRFAARILFLISLSAAGVPATALINPRFTPVDLVEQAKLILVVTPAAPDAAGRVTAPVVKCLKGEAPADRITVDLMAEWTRRISADMARSDDAPAVLFAGAAEDKQEAVFLHLAGRWLRLEAKGNGAFAMIAVDVDMRGTWAGGTDMLLQAVAYILSDPSPEVPVKVGCTWAERRVLGTIDGPVHSAQAIDLTGRGEIALFVAADNGDRIFRCGGAGKQPDGATTALKLASRSRIAVWADLDGDGRADLAGWDGEALSLWRQSAEGTFLPSGAALWPGRRGECLGLSVLDAGADGRAGLLVTSVDGPTLLVPQKDGSFRAAVLDTGDADRKKIGTPGACLVADFDGDGLPDVLEPFADGSLFYKGKGGGAFSPAARCDVAAGKGRSAAWLGDFDGDGRMDIFMSGQDDCRLWQNRGGLRFRESFALSGETAYIAQPKAVCGQTCDINNDGRQDVLIGYREGIPLVFFNRGFRSFGKSLELTEDEVIPEAAGGVQAAVVEDFNGDGGQDLAVVLADGEVRMFVRSSDEVETCTGVRVALPMGRGLPGPVAVTGWAGQRCLGAWNVTAGSPGPLIACGEPGKIVLKWHSSNGKEQSRDVTVTDEPVRLVLGKEAATGDTDPGPKRNVSAGGS